MNYIHNIYLNFNKLYYDFYEWSDYDDVINIRKIPIIKINTKDFRNILGNNIELSSKLFNIIKNKTETNKSKISSIIFTDSKNISAIKFNNKGVSIGISSFLLDDEYNILEKSKKLKESNLEYKILNKKYYILDTREEYKKKIYLLNKINKISNDTLKYIYYDCYNVEENNPDIIIKNIIKDIKNNNINICEKIYEILKPISTS